MTLRTVHVPLGDAPYDILVGPGALDDLPARLADACPAARYVIIADETVARQYGAPVRDRVAGLAPCDVITFPAGEWNKTREHWAACTDRMLELGIGRDGAVLALGGGVAGDLAGFVAATYLRGVPCVQLPTTLLAMIDSSIGGKTGVDTSHGKNLVGAFHQPRLVVADVDTLATLPAPHVSAGLAEAVKHGAIADADYFADLRAYVAPLLARDAERVTAAVVRSVEIKGAVVAADEREAGRRAILNFGHTVAHAVEAVSGFAVLHGEAVAIGMAVESRLGEQLGITAPEAAAAIHETLEAFRLPRVPPTNDVDALLEAMRADKKNRAGSVRFALIEAIGQPYQTDTENWTVEAPEISIREALST